MIKLKDILFEEEKPESEDPDKMLVINKKSGKSYYISKANFDPSLHQKPAEKKEKKKEEPQPTEKPSPKKKEAPSGKPADKPSDEKKEKEEPKKLSPSEKLEKELGSFVFVDEKERTEIADEARSMRPDLKQKLLKFEFTSFFREYDALLDTLSNQYNKEDKEGAKETVIQIRKNAKRIQAIAIAKLAALSSFTNDEVVIRAAKYYHNDSLSINGFLRRGEMINLSKEDIEQIEKNPLSGGEFSSKYMMYTIIKMDEHFKSYGAQLQNDVVVYRGIKKEVLQKFIEANNWIDNGFVSTSLNPLIAEDFTDRALVNNELNRVERTPIFKINLKKGDRVLMLPCSEDEFCVESEITLPRGCKFTITGKDEEKNVYEVSVEFPNA